MQLNNKHNLLSNSLVVVLVMVVVVVVEGGCISRDAESHASLTIEEMG